jgi:predicted nuclease with TOPRIM domain
MAEIEFAGVKFAGGRIAIILTALSSLGGASWAGFEFYKDYMDMKEIVQNIDVNEIESRNKQIEIKLNEAIDYSRSIKNDLRDDFNRMERNVDRIEDAGRDLETKVEDMIDRADERFDNKRDALSTDTDKKMEALEKRLNDKIQAFLDNPLADQ